MPARSLVLFSILALAACPSTPAPEPKSPSAAPLAAPEIVVVEERYRDDAPEGSDAAPRMKLAFRDARGLERPIEGEALAYVPFRSGVALMEASAERSLVIAMPDGARSVLAKQAAAPPARGEDGALFYAARYGLTVELHRLAEDGRDTVLARGLSSVGLLAPRADGSVLFVGALNGGIAGMWRASEDGARCLSNCGLRTGTASKGERAPVPGSVAELHAAYAALPASDATDAIGGAR